MMNNHIFSKDTKGNTIFYKWGGISKPCIVNDETVQKELEKFIRAKDLLFKTDHKSALGDLLSILLLLPQSTLTKPFKIIALIFGTPIFFTLKYFFSEIPILLAIFIAYVSVLTIFIWDYSNQVDKILRKTTL